MNKFSNLLLSTLILVSFQVDAASKDFNHGTTSNSFNLNYADEDEGVCYPDPPSDDGGNGGNGGNGGDCKVVVTCNCS